MLAARRAASVLLRARPAANLPQHRAPTTMTSHPSAPRHAAHAAQATSPSLSMPPTSSASLHSTSAPSAATAAVALSSGPAAALAGRTTASTATATTLVTSTGSIGGAGASPLTIGLASGTLGAMCGLGGAIFAIPALMRYHALPQPVAAGTALVAVSAVAVAGTAVFALRDAVHPDLAAPLAACAAVSTPLGAAVAGRLSPHVLRRGLAVFMISLSPALFLRDALKTKGNASIVTSESNNNPAAAARAAIDASKSTTPTITAATAADSRANAMEQQEEQLKEQEGSEGSRARQRAALGAAGSVIGVLSGVLGISGGSLFTPVIALMAPDLPFREVVGTSFATMVVPTVVAAASYACAGHVARPLAPMLVVGAAMGAAAGSAAALAVPDVVLRNGFACIVAALGLRMLRAPVTVAVKKR